LISPISGVNNLGEDASFVAWTSDDSVRVSGGVALLSAETEFVGVIVNESVVTKSITKNVVDMFCFLLLI
jgi:hypothetical protein